VTTLTESFAAAALSFRAGTVALAHGDIYGVAAVPSVSEPGRWTYLVFELVRGSWTPIEHYRNGTFVDDAELLADAQDFIDAHYRAEVSGSLG
jgi:hypothetical protein